ncbi:undecaprenyl-diphosphate phosphatase [Hellea balneolensis]|uniref:undecaprenyl-diphosphate phosphatase n=1 Tax=Hellea balneolensis TaxID=287478 RepID=UPI000405BD4C|nr:undecaprenyl-diphosphate phosphatase [Hellea balneolensis]
MSWLELIILSLIQGLTEFLPISSSAHLVLAPQLLGWETDQGPLIDVMAHFGSLFAVMAYFHKDVGGIISGFFDLLRRKLNTNSALALNLIIASPPALALGFFFSAFGYDVLLRSPLIIAFTTIVFGILLWISDIRGREEKTTEELTWKGAALMGLAQALALIPGTSRSGITMTAARFMHMTREESARFSMLMSLPIIGAGGLYALLKLITEPGGTTGLSEGLIVAVLSFAAAYACIALFMKWVSKIGFFPFMVYRLLLGAGLLLWIFTGA